MTSFLIYNSMNIIQPYDLNIFTVEGLLHDNKILSSKDNKQWRATIFPKSTVLNVLPMYDSHNIITQIDDIIFDGFTILSKTEQTIYTDNNTKRDLIKCKEFGDFNDSVKRYIQIDNPIDIVSDAQIFANLPSTDYSMKDKLNVKIELIHKPDLNINEFTPRRKPSMFPDVSTHPHISNEKAKDTVIKNNNKATIEQILRWAKDKGIKYIYSINEYRPYIISTDYVAPYVFYTIKGAL